MACCFIGQRIMPLPERLPTKFHSTFEATVQFSDNPPEGVYFVNNIKCFTFEQKGIIKYS